MAASAFSNGLPCARAVWCVRLKANPLTMRLATSDDGSPSKAIYRAWSRSLAVNFPQRRARIGEPNTAQLSRIVDIFPYLGTSPNGGVSVPVLLTSDWSPRTHWTRSRRRSGPVAEALGAEPSAVVPKDPPAPDAPLEVAGRSSQASSAFHLPTVE